MDMDPQRDLERVFAQVPDDQYQLLRRFRRSHPAKAIEVDGKQWSYISCGQGDTMLLLLAGGFLRADMWFYTILELERRFRIIATDSHLLVGLSAFAALEAVPRILKLEDVSRVNLVGLSAGGGMAQILLQRYPNLVEDLVLSHTGALDMQPGMETQTRRLARIVRLLPMALVRRILLRRTSGASTARTPWRAFHDAYFRQSAAAITKPMILAFLRDGLALRKAFPFEPEALRDWRGRTLIVTSKDDSLTFGAAERLRERYPRSRVHVFEDGGHHAFMLYPEAYTAILDDFFRETTA
jgi:pimeloyl-ACP methyl ester carboxylesterase